MRGDDNRQSSGCDADFERFFFHSLNLLAITGFDGFFKRLNPAWADATGYSLDELMARPFIELVHPDDRESTAKEAARLAGGEQSISFENRYLRKDGSILWLLWNATAWEEEERIYASAQDITELKRAEAEARDNLRKLQTVRFAFEVELNGRSLAPSNDPRRFLDTIQVYRGWACAGAALVSKPRDLS